MVVDKKVSMIFASIIFVIIAITTLGTVISTVDNEASKVTPEGDCVHVKGCYWNTTTTNTTGECQVESGNITACASGQPTAYAGNAIMATGGVVTLLLMMGVLITIVAISLRKK